LRKLRQDRFSLIIINYNVPTIGGLDVCREIRSRSDIGLITLTISMGGERRTVNAGDDYVTKPFSMRDLLGHIRVALRQTRLSSQVGPALVSFDQIEMNFGTRHISVDGQEVRLTPKEFLLLRSLVAGPNEAIPHVKLLQSVWGPDHCGEVEYPRVFINRIRKKIEPDPTRPRYILTEPWFGYRFHLCRRKHSCPFRSSASGFVATSDEGCNMRRTKHRLTCVTYVSGRSQGFRRPLSRPAGLRPGVPARTASRIDIR
jgi:two-component system KDP operon response regulator KdpE